MSHYFDEAPATASAPRTVRVDVPGANHYTLLLHSGPPALPAVRTFLDQALR